jgi:uncharacterized protein (DUF433 family)
MDSAMGTAIDTLLSRSPDVCGGRMRIEGTRVTVHQIAACYQQGWTPEEIADQYPHVTLAQVYAALAYRPGARSRGGWFSAIATRIRQPERVKLSLYLDEDTMARSLIAGLRARGADVQTVIDAGLRGKDDRTQLHWAASKAGQYIRSMFRTNAGFTKNFSKVESITPALSSCRASVTQSSSKFGFCWI